MLYFSAEAKLLRLADKVDRQVPGVYERFITNGKLDMQKAKDVFIAQDWTRKAINDAGSVLLNAGYVDSNGITASGTAKVAQMETARLAAADALGIGDFARGLVSPPSDALVAQLNNTDL